jgi:2-polyprenyl-3-methyl-5-hydroxy-6-metoxy-1,4-benzoquinol methylase
MSETQHHTISETYKALNEDLHKTNKHYGCSGQKYLKDVWRLVHMVQSREILDYGCGKSTLQANLPFEIQQYDPAVETYSKEPEPSDIVVCTDVMEHIEPECLEGVLAHILELTKKATFFVIATRPAQKFLKDGRNAHLIVQPAIWWLNMLTASGYTIDMFHNGDGEFKVICLK